MNVNECESKATKRQKDDRRGKVCLSLSLVEIHLCSIYIYRYTYYFTLVYTVVYTLFYKLSVVYLYSAIFVQ